MPVTDLISESPDHEQALATRVFHSRRHVIASGVFHLKHNSIDQTLAAKVINLDHHTIERVPAPKLVHLNRHKLAPRIFHLISPRHWAVWYTQTTYQRTEIRVRRSAAGGLLNLAHFVLAQVRNRAPKAHPDRSTRFILSGQSHPARTCPLRRSQSLGTVDATNTQAW